jgi:hypothetical protein
VGVFVKSIELSLKSGSAIISADEVDWVIQSLLDFKQVLPEQTYRDNEDAYVTHGMVKSILQQAFPDEMQLMRRLGRLWSAVGRFASNRSIAFDAYCKACNVKLSEHALSETPCYGMDKNSVNVVVSRESLRNCKAAFLAKNERGMGVEIKKDYQYLVRHLPTQ